jgi:hypothetical protein
VVLLDWTLVQKKTEKNKINVNCISHTVVENLKQFAFKQDKSRVVHRTFWLIKVVPTWKKFGKRWSKLNKACYAIRAVKFVMSPKTLKTVYCIFWGNSYGSKEIFAIQTRIVWILTNKSKRDSCRERFKKLRILTLPSQYIYSLLVFVVKNRDLFSLNS